MFNYDSIDCREIAVRLGVQPQDGTYSASAENSTFHCFNKAAHKNGDRNPSLSIYYGGFLCGGCGIKGNRRDLVMDILRIDENAADEWLRSTFPHAVSNSNVPVPIASPAAIKEQPSDNKRSYQVRHISSSAKHKTLHYRLTPDQLRDVTEQDIINIEKEINKFYSLDAFVATRCKIIDGPVEITLKKTGEKRNIKVYGIVLPPKGAANMYSVPCLNENCDEAIVVEGVTDFLTAATMQLHAHFTILARFNKTTAIKVNKGISNYFVVRDDDETVDQLRKYVHNEVRLKNTIRECILSDINYKDYTKKVKDLSDLWEYFNRNGKDFEFDSAIDWFIGLIRKKSQLLVFEGESFKDENLAISEQFWSDDGKTIFLTAFYKELENRGWCWIRDEFSSDVDKFELVQIKNNIIIRKFPAELPNYAMRVIAEQEIAAIDPKLGNAVARALHRDHQIFSPVKLSYLPFKNIDTYRDDFNTFGLFFNDFTVGLSADEFGYGIEKIDYCDLSKPIWASSIKNNDVDFKIISETFDYYSSDQTPYLTLNSEKHAAKSEFAEFLKDICRNPDTEEPDIPRLMSLVSVFGYLCHDRQPGEAITVIFTESNLGHTSEGGTGKSMIIKALGHVRNICILPCRDMKSSDDFKYDTFMKNDRVIVFEDVNKSFDFQTLYNTSTEGITINKKMARKVTLLDWLSPKTVVTSNDPVASDDGWSTERRRFDMELLRYYNKLRSPEIKFGHRFFSGWDSKEWSKFYGFACWCVSEFFRNQNRIADYESRTIKLRQLIVGLSQEAVDDIDEWFRSQALSTYHESNHGIVEFLVDTLGKRELRTKIRDTVGVEQKRLPDKIIDTLLNKYCHINKINTKSVRKDKKRHTLYYGSLSAFGLSDDDLKPSL